MIARLIPLLARLGALVLDGLLLVGCGVFIYGVWLAWHPAGFMVGGLVLMALAFIFGTRRVPRGEAHK